LPSTAFAMSLPIRIDFPSIDDVGSPERFAAMAERGTHLVLQFPETAEGASKTALVARLAEALPDHSVFDSGGARGTTWVTIMPVVPRRDVIERRTEILAAIDDYRRTCASLVDHYRRGALPPEWCATEHGGECRFQNGQSGQIVEAPFATWKDKVRVDPYFFALFVRTTPGHARVAELIREDFHDGARILDLTLGTRA
jgi:hypothetical protein